MNFFQKILFGIFKFIYPSKINGLEKICDGPAIIVCNHFSVVDCGFMLKLSKKKLYFLAKKEAFKNKLFSKILSSFGAIPINRDNPSIKSLFTAIKLLKNGNKLVIFPEGTRNKTGTDELQPLKSGSGVFAVKARCPIIPVTILKKPRPFIRTRLLVGDKIDLSDYYNKDLTEEVVAELDGIISLEMKSLHAQLKSTVLKKKGKKNVSC